MATVALNEFILKMILYQIFWFGQWIIILLVFKDMKRVDHDTKNRLVSIVHGLGSLIFSIIDLFVYKPSFQTMNSNFENNALIFSISYFVYDTIGCYLIDMADRDLVMHHVVTLVGLSSCLYYGMGGPYCYFGVFLTEISNFPMHVRKILENIGLRHTILFEYLESAYFALYSVARGLLGPIAIYIAIANWNYTPKAIMLVSALIVFQSCTFIKTMMEIVRLKIGAKKERDAKGVQLWWFHVNPKVHEMEYIKNYEHKKIF